MVLTAAQTTAFFENADQMALPHETVVQLAQEGIETVGDLVDFDKDTLQQVADNLRRPGGRIPDPNPQAAEGATIPTPPFVFGAKSQKRLLVASNLMKFYETVGRPLTGANVRWNNVMRNFGEQWKAITDRRSEEDPDTPVISKALPIIRWTEAFCDHLHRCIGVRNIPLAYVIRDDPEVPPICPPLAPDQPYSEEHGSIEADLVARGSHTHGLFRDDNASVYYKLEEATRSTPYADSIKPFQCTKDGRAAFLAITAQYAGTDKWEAEIKKQDTLLHTRKWKGQSNFTLECFVQQHRNAFVSMQACSQHVEYQLPNDHTRVGYVLDAIECDDAGLQAAMANILDDTGPEGKRNNFEAAVAYLLPKDPVVKKRAVTAQKRGAADISETTADVSAFGTKAGIGKTGVHLRYHQRAEYKALSDEQKDELREWREANPAESKKGDKKKVKWDKKPSQKKLKTEKQIAAAIKQGIKDKVKEAEDAKAEEVKTKAYIMSLIQELSTEDNSKPHSRASIGNTAATAVQPPSVTLKSILKRAGADKS